MASKDRKPPRTARWLLGLLRDYRDDHSILADMNAVYQDILKRHGLIKAASWYWYQALGAILQYLILGMSRGISMIRSYAKITLRNIKRHKGYSFINIAGLALGFASCMLIFIWSKAELSYDRHFIKSDRIFRLVQNNKIGDIEDRTAKAPYIAGPTFRSEIPEIETFTRLMRESARILVNEKNFDSYFYYADADFFQIFSHTFIEGNPRNALSEPGSIVLTEETALRLFGNSLALGKILNIEQTAGYRVTGVVRDNPGNSHFRFPMLVSFSTFEQQPQESDLLTGWFLNHGWTYLLLKENTNSETVAQKIRMVSEQHSGEEGRRTGYKQEFQLQKLTDIHLRSRLNDDIGKHGDIRHVYTFIMIALFILAIACMNYINLTTARSAVRGREVGVRKAIGAHRKNLLLQFLGESILMSLSALVLAVIPVLAILPSFNRLAGTTLRAASLGDPGTMAAAGGMAFLTGLLAGIWPALFLSAFHPTFLLKGSFNTGPRKSVLRGSLVVIQFAVSIILIAATLIMMRQLKYMKTSGLGFDADRLLVIRINDADSRLRSDYDGVKTDLLQNPNIPAASLSDGIPGTINLSLLVNIKGLPESIGNDAEIIIADYDFVDTYGIEIAKGRNFSRTFGSDADGAYLINETAAREFGLGLDAVGRVIGADPEYWGEIVGVMKDFHYKSLKEKIRPLIVWHAPQYLKTRGYYLTMRISGGNIAETINFIRSGWMKKSKSELMYFFAVDRFNTQYRSEEQLTQVIKFFSLVAIFLACMGIFGLSSFTAEQKTKEIGIRKVLGAPAFSIIGLINRTFSKWILIANVVAWPTAWYAMNRWIHGFAYRTDITPWTFMISAALTIFMSLLAVSYQSVKAAGSDPVKSLRYE